MTDRESFIAAIAAAPDDDAPRLVFADWLEERGQEELAEFIRVQCELARTPIADTLAGGDRRICERCDHVKEFRTEPLGKCPACGSEFIRKLRRHDETHPDTNRLQRRERDLYSKVWYLVPGANEFWASRDATLVRGFIESLTCEAADWIEHGDAILRQHPVQEVRLTTMPEVEGCRLDSVYFGDENGLFMDRLKGRTRKVMAQMPRSLSISALLKSEWPTVRTWHLPRVWDQFPVIASDQVTSTTWDAMRDEIVRQYGVPASVLRGDPSIPTPRGTIDYPSNR